MNESIRRVVAVTAGTLFLVVPLGIGATSLGFDAEMMGAMTRMNAAMTRAPMTGDPDRDFISMMVPHHAGAIEMATLELEHGHDARLRRLAQEIVVTQQSEIVVMRAVARDLSAKNEKKEAQ